MQLPTLNKDYAQLGLYLPAPYDTQSGLGGSTPTPEKLLFFVAAAHAYPARPRQISYEGPPEGAKGRNFFFWTIHTCSEDTVLVRSTRGGKIQYKVQPAEGP